ncbi:MAG: hypothetical protein H6629_03275 [Calditrichae bacterium]|nr:hypothetical protein [Calditrichia bacterium]
MGNLKLTMRTKLLAALLISSVLGMGIVGTLSFYSAENMIEQDVSNQLVSVREIKARQVENYFGFIRKQVLTFSQDQMIIDAMREFKAAYHDASMLDNVSPEELAKYEEKVKSYYRSEYLTRLQPNVDDKRNLDQYWPGEAQSTYLQYHYLAITRTPPEKNITWIMQKTAAITANCTQNITRLSAVICKILVITIFFWSIRKLDTSFTPCLKKLTIPQAC